MARIGLAEVARQAGVSVSTASRVLNRDRVDVPVSSGTRQRVEAAAGRLGYRPSAAARALRTGSTRSIGVLGNNPQAFWLWDEGDGFASEMVRGLMEAAIARGFHLTLLTGEGGGAAARMPDLGMVDGLLVFNRDLSATPGLVEALEGSGRPVVFLLDYPEDRPCHALAPDDEALARLATEKLLASGHRRIGFVRTAAWEGIFGRRQRGWRAALRQAGIEAPAAWCLGPDEAAAVHGHGLSALVCANGVLARALRAAVPRETALLAIVHADAGGRPPADLAGVTFPLAEIAAAGAHRLIRLAGGEDIERHKELYAPRYTPGPTFADSV